MFPWLFYAVIGAALLPAVVDAFPGVFSNDENKLATGRIGTKKDLKGITGSGGLQISDTVQLSKKACFEGITVIGPTGSGKTTSLFFPNLLSDTIQNSSLVISDPKGELYRNTANYQRGIGREPILFAPLNPTHSLKYNPLEMCKDSSEVSQLAQILLINGALAVEITTGKKAGGVEWSQMAAPLLTASLLYVKKKGKPMNTIPEALKLLICLSDEEIDHLFSNQDHDIKMKYMIFKSGNGADRTLGSIKITLATNLQLFTDHYLIETTKQCDFKPQQLRKKPIALYVMTPERKSAYLSPFTAAFYSQFIDKLIDYYSNDSLPVFFLWDEFANIGQLNNFSQNVATARSREINFTLCLQSLTQLYQLYGKENALAILNNSKSKIVLPGLTDVETLKYISELCDNTEVETLTRSSNNNGTSTSRSVTTKRLLSPGEVRTMGDNKLLIIAHNRQPVIDYQNVYYKQDKYLRHVHPAELPYM